MQRSVTCRLEADIVGTCDIVLSIAVASSAMLDSELLTITVDGVGVDFAEVHDDHGVRLHRAAGLLTGRLEVDYRATVDGIAPAPIVTDIDLIRYARPSRYCESDRLSAFARAEFRWLSGLTLLDTVTRWVGQRVAYVAGSSRSTDGAVATLLARQGVCRDFAHLVIALLRACDTPARLVSVYAPGLQPMDFHAVAEAYIEGHWYVADATGLAPRTAMQRIATGRDAADAAFLTVAGELATLTSIEVTAITDGDLPYDNRAVAIWLT